MANSIKLDQKRLAHLRQSLYGKQKESLPSQPTVRSSAQKSVEKTDHKVASSSPVLGTERHITRDLMKVAFLSTLAIFLQLLVHAALINKWVHINFYGITY